MESKLLLYIQNYHNLHKMLPTPRELKDRAIIYSNHKDHFKASKGWLEKFMKRNDIYTGRRQMFIKAEETEAEDLPPPKRRVRGKSAQQAERVQISPGSITSRRTEFQLNQD